MQNDVLKNNIAPWQEKGRWYKFKILSDGTNYSVDTDNSDVHTATISTTTGNLGVQFKYISNWAVRVDEHTVISTSTNISTLAQLRCRIEGTFAIHLNILPGYFSELTLWVFGDLA